MFQDHISSLFLVVLLWRMSVVSSSPVVQQGSLQLEWESWKSTHGKRYSHDREDRERSAVWLSNRELVESHNALGGGTSYSLAMNQFGDMVYQPCMGFGWEETVKFSKKMHGPSCTIMCLLKGGGDEEKSLA